MGVDPFPVLAEATLAASLAILLVLALRRPVRAALGAGAAYALWLCVPVALAAVLLPRDPAAPLALPVAWQVVPAAAAVPVEPQAGWSWREALAPLWLAGALVSAAWLGRQQRRFRRALGPLRRRTDGLYQSAMATAGLPAVAGVLRPRILLPEDFERRYTAQEQQLVLEHERAHVRRGDLLANALAALLRCLFWFNPLLAFAQARFRLDQELACDARVIARHPRARRQYGEAMLKTQFDPSPLPLGCHWQARHPIRERIDMLKRPTPTAVHWTFATLFAAALSAGTGYAAWAAQPAAAPAVAASTPSETLYLVARQVRYEGIAGDGVLSQWVRPGEPAVSTVGDGAQRWKSTLTVAPGTQDGTAVVRMRIERGEPGEVVAEPAMLVRHGEPAVFEQGAADGGLLYRSQLLVLPLEGSREATEARLRELLATASTVVATAESPLWPPPAYPAEAARERIGGKVMLLVSVAADGSVADVQVEEATPAGVFEAVAIEAARKWKFRPEMKDGRPVAGQVRVPVSFEPDTRGEQDANGG
ncbi:MAG TPA: TonB family protein [Pseudoxanthomonas sp.]|nr:TonB family protein [Pseudoxanthomonas sp.]